MRNAQAADAIRAEPPPLPSRGPYRVIVADPPWAFDVRNTDTSHRIVPPYPTMSVAEICSFPVGPLAASDCVLWLWVTNSHMREAFTVLDAWGFRQKTMLTWAKPQFGTGDYLRGQTEHCLMPIKGKPVITLSNQSTLITAPKRGHSRKPDEFYALVEGLCPAPRYLELWSREERNGWNVYGNEVCKAA